MPTPKSTTPGTIAHARRIAAQRRALRAQALDDAARLGVAIVSGDVLGMLDVATAIDDTLDALDHLDAETFAMALDVDHEVQPDNATSIPVGWDAVGGMEHGGN